MAKKQKPKQEFSNFNLSKTGRGFVMISLIMASIMILGLLFVNIFGTEVQAVSAIDNLVSIIFLVLFIFLFSKAHDKSRYFKNNWWYLLGAIPIPYVATDNRVIGIVLGLLLAGRFIVRLVLLIKMSRLVIPKFYALQIVTLLSFFALLSTELFYAAEHATNPQVQTHFDSFWWTMVTTTTVGYGDITPVTTEGRIIAIFMMLMGIGIVGLVTGSAASFLTKRMRARYEKIEDKIN